MRHKYILLSSFTLLIPGQIYKMEVYAGEMEIRYGNMNYWFSKTKCKL